MCKYEVDICFRNGFSIDDLNRHVRSNPLYIFVSKTRNTKAQRATYYWQHKAYPGTVKLKKDKGRYWVEIAVKDKNKLLGALISWLFNNADTMVHWLEVYEYDW